MCEILEFIKRNYLIFLIFLLGLALRIYDLASESIWYDEAFSANIIKQKLIPLISAVFSDPKETNPPLYYILLRYWTLIFGNSEFSLRLMSVLFGSASIVAIYALGKLLFNKRAALISALILSVSVCNIEYSQEARAYSMLVLLSIISIYSLVKLTQRKSIYYYVLYIVSNILVLYTHYYGIFFLAAQNIFCLTLFIHKRKAGEITLKKWIVFQILILLAFIPGLIHLFKITTEIQESFWITAPTTETLYHYLRYYSGSVYLLVLFVSFTLISVVGLKRILGVPGLKAIFNSNKDDKPELAISDGYRVYLLVLWFFIPIAIPVIYSFISTPMFVMRYGLIAACAYYLLVSYGISSLKSKWAVLAAGLVILILSVPVLDRYFESVRRPQWREVVAEIEKSAGYNDVIVLQPGQGYLPIKYYQTRDDFLMLQLKEKFPAFKNLGNRSVWVIMTANPQYRKYIRDGLGDRYNFELEKHFVGVDLFRLRRK